ncbi:MAG: flippase [Bacteroidia bacterium]|nr:flippase [Bacteroidia bacterium]
MKKLGSYWWKSGAYTFLERFSLQLFRFGSFYLLVRALTKVEFGIWTLFLIITAIVEVVRIGLIQNALIKALTSNKDEKVTARINTASFVLNVIFALIVSLLLVVIARLQMQWFGDVLLENLLHMYIFTNLLLVPFFHFTFVAQAKFDFKTIFIANFFRQIVFFIFVLIVFLVPNWGFRVLHLAAVQAIGALVGSLAAYWLGRKYISFSPKLDLDWVRWLFHYGKYVIGTNLSSMLSKSIDQLMLGAMISPIATAVYGTAIKIANLVEVPTQSMAAIVFPKTSQRIEEEGTHAAKGLYEKSVGVLLALIVPGVLFVMLFPEFVIQLVAGDQYLDAVPLLRIAMLYGLFVPFSRQFGTMLDAMGKPGVNFFLVMMGAIVNGVLNYFMIKSMGIMGAAYATLISYALFFVVNQIILYREVGIQLWRVLVYTLDVYSKGFFLLRKKLVGKGS